MKKTITTLIFILTTSLFNLNAQSGYNGVNLDTVKAQKFDMGKMWTFENPPLNISNKLTTLSRLENGWIKYRNLH